MNNSNERMSSSPRTVKVGLLLPHFEKGMDGVTPGWADLLALARDAEDAGFDSLWFVDHLLIKYSAVFRQMGAEVSERLEAAPPQGVWECWSLMAALAAGTRRVELGQIVTCAGYRNPALLAKMADTIDEISGGRVILGIGAGDYEDEHRRFGYPWEQRVGRFEEAMKIIAPLLRTGSVDFAGEHWSARECELRPRGPRPEGLPIMIGSLARGPRMQRLTMEYADLWNAWIAGRRSHPDEVPPLTEALDRACERHGRDPATLGRTLTVGVCFPGYRHPERRSTPITGTPEEIAATFHAFAEQGISHLQVYLAPMTRAGIAMLAPVLELL